MNAEDRRFLAVCHALAGMLARDTNLYPRGIAVEAVELGDALICRLAETAPAAEPPTPLTPSPEENA